MNCTNSYTNLNIIEAESRSPYFVDISEKRFKSMKLDILTGINDKVVSIDQSVQFYNKIIKKQGSDKSNMVTKEELLNIFLRKRIYYDGSNRIYNKEILLRKKFENISITIFNGEHEMVPKHAFKSILSSIKGKID
ncbi:hypothetical protein HOK00_09720 [bacterium]|nr:hypothetical protein [bacterium]